MQDAADEARSTQYDAYDASRRVGSSVLGRRKLLMHALSMYYLFPRKFIGALASSVHISAHNQVPENDPNQGMHQSVLKPVLPTIYTALCNPPHTQIAADVQSTTPESKGYYCAHLPSEASVDALSPQTNPPATPSQPQPLQGKTEPEVTGLLAESSISPAQAKPADTNADVIKHHVTISPATTNRSLKFVDGFKQVFPASSLRSAFENHDAFNAVFEDHRDGRASYTDEFMSLLRGGQTPSKKTKKKFPGMIVATSEDEDLATAAGAEGKSGGTAGAGAGAVGAESTLTGASKGLVSTIMTAYNRHCDLVLSPDDVWLAILAQFCVYVNNHEEALRSRIVKHADQKELEVFSFGDLTTADYKGMIVDLLEEMRKKVKSPELADWFRPGFSTTTEKDEVCAAATAMASLQSYFLFTMHLGCGIPSATMLGTVADWKLLREKVDRLLEFEVEGNPDGNVMEMWVGYLRKVCDGFAESAEHPDSAKTLEFWDKVLSHLRGMSGPSYITGWLSVFTCFDKDGTFIGDHIIEGSEFPLIKDETICHNVVSCPVKIDDNGNVHDGTLFVGQVAFEAKQGGGEVYPTVRPRNEWCMAVAVKEGAAAKEGVCMI